METCDIPKGSKTCEEDGKRCKYCEQFVRGMSDYSFKCTKYSTRKHKIPVLNIYKNGMHLRLNQCVESNKSEGNIND